MMVEQLKNKLSKKTPILMSPLGFALSACGGGGGGGAVTNNSSSSTNSTSYGYQISSREIESNNSLNTANYLTQLTFSGQSYSADDSDYYFVNLPDWKVFDVSFQSEHWADHQVIIFDSDGIGVASTAIAKSGVVSADPYASGGVYIQIFSDGYDDEDYTVTVTQGSGVYENEPNNYKNDADTITAGVTIVGQSFSSIDDDYFTFTANSSVSTLSFSSDHWADHTVTILDAAGNTMTIKEIAKSGEIAASTFVGSKYLVLVEGDGYDDEAYTLTLEGSSVGTSTPNGIPLANFVEQDTPETPNDYDWAILDRQTGKFALHIENFQPFDKVFEYIANNGHSFKYSIAYGNTNSEDPGYVSKGYSGYSWINADRVEVTGSGYLKQIIVTDVLIKDTIIDNGYDYISFGIASSEGFGLSANSAWAMDDFAVSDVLIA